MSKPVGGRGLKAPYETVVVRIPKPLELEVEQMSEHYRELALAGKAPEKVPSKLPSSEIISYDEALVLANKIIREKGDKKQAVKKLLQVIYYRN